MIFFEEKMTENPERKPTGEIQPPQEDPLSDGLSPAERLWNRIVHLGLGETTLRVGTAVVSLLLVLVVVWVMGRFVLNRQNKPSAQPETAASATQVSTPLTPLVLKSEPVLYSGFGINRLALIHTDRPAQVRTTMIEYTIMAGDTLFGIAEKFGLKPQTLLWSNRHILGDDPHNIFPGVNILIPVMDGAVYKWNTGDGLNGVASFYNVTPDTIIDWPANNLDRATLGDYAFPNIPEGTLLFVPGGVGEFTDWLPTYTREKPAESSISGSACGILTSGYIGSGPPFMWPTSETYISGFQYSPETNHRAIDIGGKIGNPIYAVDDGVIVYSNWNEHGYGNLIVVDHGNGWQSVYAHLDNYLNFCGDNVVRGQQIGMLGTTGNSSGPHLHFELRHENYGAVNPWDFLQ